MKKTLCFIAVLIMISISCKKDTLQDTIDPCTSNCDLELSVIWSKPWLEFRDFPIFSPEIYGDNLIVGYKSKDNAIIVQSVDKNNGSVNWKFPIDSYVQFLRHRFYNDLLAINYEDNNGDGHLVLLNVSDGSVKRHVQSPKINGIYFSLDKDQIIYAVRDGDVISFYRIPVADTQQSILITTLDYPQNDHPFMDFESHIFFTDFNDDSFFVTYNSHERTSYQFDMSRDTLYKIDHVIHSDSRQTVRLEHNQQVVLLFEESQLSFYGPRFEHISKTMPVAYTNRAVSKYPVWKNNEVLYLNTTDSQKDILAINIGRQDIQNRYVNMGDCDQIKIIDDNILVTCNKVIYNLDALSNQWLWRSKANDNTTEKVWNTPAIDVGTKKLYYFQGFNLICASWPED